MAVYAEQVLTRAEACDIIWRIFTDSRVNAASVLIDERYLSTEIPAAATSLETTRSNRKLNWDAWMKEEGTPVFTDIANSPYINSIQQLYVNNVISGFDDGHFQPDGSITRAQACRIIMQCLFSDRFD